MDNDAKKIRKLAKVMRDEGVLVYKTPETEIHLSPIAVFHEEQSKDLTPETKEETLPQYTEEDLLFWSSPGLSDEKMN